jgi:hypothetical protein
MINQHSKALHGGNLECVSGLDRMINAQGQETDDIQAGEALSRIGPMSN